MPKDSSRRNDTRRANKDRRARLEELRRQQKAAERRKNFLFIGSAIVLALALIGAAIVPAYLHDRANKAKSQPLHQAAATKAEKAAGCLGVHNDPVPKDSDRSHVVTAVDYAKTKFGDTRGGTPPVRSSVRRRTCALPRIEANGFLRSCDAAAKKSSRTRIASCACW